MGQKKKKQTNIQANCTAAGTHWLINSKGQAMCVKKILVTSELPKLTTSDVKDTKGFLTKISSALKNNNVPPAEWGRLAAARVYNDWPETQTSKSGGGNPFQTWECFSDSLLKWTVERKNIEIKLRQEEEELSGKIQKPYRKVKETVNGRKAEFRQASGKIKSLSTVDDINGNACNTAPEPNHPRNLNKGGRQKRKNCNSNRGKRQQKRGTASSAENNNRENVPAMRTRSKRKHFASHVPHPIPRKVQKLEEDSVNISPLQAESLETPEAKQGDSVLIKSELENSNNLSDLTISQIWSLPEQKPSLPQKSLTPISLNRLTECSLSIIKKRLSLTPEQERKELPISQKKSNSPKNEKSQKAVNVIELIDLSEG